MGRLNELLRELQANGIEEALATREFYVHETGRRVVVTVARPKPLPGHSSLHYCLFEIDEGENTSREYMIGSDSLRALEMASQILDFLVDALDRRLNHRLRWRGDDSGGYGWGR